MDDLPHHPPVRHGLFDLPLFRWSATRDTAALTAGGRWVHRRTGLPSNVANAIAELAGIGAGMMR